MSTPPHRRQPPIGRMTSSLTNSGAPTLTSLAKRNATSSNGRAKNRSTYHH